MADRSPWVGPEQSAGVGSNPYTLVLTVSGVAKTTGDIYSKWQAGWEVLPWPVDYRTSGRREMLEPFANPVDGLRRLDFTLKEWVGLAVYRLTGRTNALFPGPAG